MTNSTKGLERRGRGYRERVGDYCLDYCLDYYCQGFGFRPACWSWGTRRRSVLIAAGYTHRLRDARVLAATAVALQEERP